MSMHLVLSGVQMKKGNQKKVTVPHHLLPSTQKNLVVAFILRQM